MTPHADAPFHPLTHSLLRGRERVKGGASGFVGVRQ